MVSHLKKNEFHANWTYKAYMLEHMGIWAENNSAGPDSRRLISCHPLQLVNIATAAKIENVR